MLVALGTLAVPDSPRAQVQNRIYIPAFITDASLITLIDDVAKASPPGSSTVVLNFGISQGPNGTNPPQAGSDGKTLSAADIATLNTAVAHARNGGVRLFGYVTSCQADLSTYTSPSCRNSQYPALQHDADHMIASTANAPKGYIDAWFQYVPGLDGIYFDEGGNLQPPAMDITTWHNYFAELRRRLSASYPGKLTMLNDPSSGGYINDPHVFAVTDLLQTYEADGVPTSWPPAYGTSYYPSPDVWDNSKVFMLLGNIADAQIQTTVSTLSAHSIHNFYLQAGSTNAAYGAPATAYWTHLAGAAYGYPTIVNIAGRGLGTVQSTSPAGLTCASGVTCNNSWFGPGVAVTLHATPSSGSQFTGWTGPCTPSPSDPTTCSYTPSSIDPAAATVTATLITLQNVPILSGIATSTTPPTASITWSTDVSADSNVDYGTTTAYGSIASGNTGTAHTVPLTGLSAGTLYHYRVRSKTGPGATDAISPDRVLPLITSVSSGTPGQTTATITWLTNPGFSSNHVVDYGTTTSYGSTQAGSAANGTSHAVTLTALSPSTTYHFRVRSTDGTDSAVSSDFSFSTATGGVTFSVASLTDAFDSFDTSKWTMSLSVSGDWAEAKKGVLSLEPVANSGGTGVWVDSTSAYSLLSSSATVNALEMVAASGGINAKFMFHAPGAAALNEVAGFWYEGGTLYAYYYSGGVQYATGSAAYSRDAHAWWRLRHSGSTVFWETSRDRSTWTVLGQVAQSALTFDLGNGILGFNVKGFGSGNATPGIARFTHLNVAPTPIAALTDGFTSIDPARWYLGLGSAGSSGAATGGVLYLSAEPSVAAGSASVISMRPYALTGSAIKVKVPQVVSSGGSVNQIFRVAPGPFAYADELGFWYESGTLYAYQRAHGASSALATLSYSPTVHAWWRLREAAGIVYWETSADGVSWTPQASMAVTGLSFSPAVVSVYMSTNEFGSGTATPGTAQFTSLNVP